MGHTEPPKCLITAGSELSTEGILGSFIGYFLPKTICLAIALAKEFAGTLGAASFAISIVQILAVWLLQN